MAACACVRLSAAECVAGCAADCAADRRDWTSPG
jgi:hypothetical protein